MTQVAAIRADVITKPVDVMGYEEPICLLTVHEIVFFNSVEGLMSVTPACLALLTFS